MSQLVNGTYVCQTTGTKIQIDRAEDSGPISVYGSITVSNVALPVTGNWHVGGNYANMFIAGGNSDGKNSMVGAAGVFNWTGGQVNSIQLAGGLTDMNGTYAFSCTCTRI